MRTDSRKNDQIRKISIQPGFQKNAFAGVLYSMGGTRVICSATHQPKTAPHLVGTGTGWITAEYALLPASASSRVSRQKAISSGRTHEIQRLIGRALRSSIDLSILGERAILIDCDVVQADGGTRTASINGAFLALRMAANRLLEEKLIEKDPITREIAAISCGKVGGNLLLDLDYEEDKEADVDLNIVMTKKGEIIEIQGTGEEAVFTENELSQMLKLSKKGINAVFAEAKKFLK